jgi:hypothetical protein
MAPKPMLKEMPNGTTVTVPMADFFKYIKVNGFQGTVTFHAGPIIALAREALDAKRNTANTKL